jgi:Spy/CpxP family protein refolding chaperone
MNQTSNNRRMTLPTLSTPVRMLLATLMVAAAGSLSLIQPAFAQPMGGHGGMHGGMHGEMGGGPGGMMGGPRIGRMLDRVNATADQRAQIKTIMDAAHTDMQALRTSGSSLRQQMQAAFAQPTVDARAVEALRAQISAQHDSVSKRMTQAMLDVSRVLTPEQRKTMADAMAKRQSMMQRHAAERAAVK